MILKSEHITTEINSMLIVLLWENLQMRHNYKINMFWITTINVTNYGICWLQNTICDTIVVLCYA